MSKPDKPLPYLREIANLLNSYRDIKEVGGWKIEQDGASGIAVRLGGSGQEDVRMKEAMDRLRGELQTDIEKIDWLLSLWR